MTDTDLMCLLAFIGGYLYPLFYMECSWKAFVQFSGRKALNNWQEFLGPF
jgi:hypothetical protein